MKPPKLVLFDAGGVLVTPPFELHRKLTGDRVSIEDVRRVFYAVYSETSIPSEGQHGDFWETYADRLRLPSNPFSGLDPLRNDGEHGLVRWNKATLGAAEVLASIKQKGIAVAVVSNAAGNVHELLDEAGACYTGAGRGIEIDFIFDSGDKTRYADEWLSRKPNTTMLDDACNYFDVSPTDTLFIGDAIWADLLAAQRAGVPFLHMDPFGDCRDTAFESEKLAFRSKGHDHVNDLHAVLPFALGERSRSTVQSGRTG